MNTSLPPLNTLRVFEAAARLGGFSRAAEELYVTHGAVSRQIIGLEEALGVALFERRNRAVFLTPEGEVLYHAAAEALDTVRRAVVRLRQKPEQRPFVLSCERSLSMRWLIPRLSRFQDRHPDIRLHLSTGGGAVDFAGEFLDLAIRRADFPLDPAWHVEPIFEEQIGPVCRPDISRQLQPGTADTPFTLLHSRTRPDAWRTWSDKTGRSLKAADERSFDHFFLTVEAAASGLGIAVAPRAIVLDDIATGRLSAPFGFVPDGSRYVLISQTPIEEDPRKQTLLAWLREATKTESTEPQ